MNENGLVVELMWLDATVYPGPMIDRQLVCCNGSSFSWTILQLSKKL